MNNEKILVMDFGGQLNLQIARKVRDAKVYCEIFPYNASLERIRAFEPKGIILTGGSESVLEADALKCDPGIFNLGVPVLGVSYGMQLMAKLLGGTVKAAEKVHGRVNARIKPGSGLFQSVSGENACWMNYTCIVETPPEGFSVTAEADGCPVAAMENAEKKLYAVQFYPESSDTSAGNEILHNFLYKICGCSGNWDMSSFVRQQVIELKNKIGDKKVLLALSGGVDSSVCAVLLNRAVGKQLTCIFVDHGLLRKNEADQVEKVFRERFDLNLIRVNAGPRFLKRLEGVTDPEKKRKIIGEEFIRVFEEEARKIGKVDFLAQGTIYPDIVESGVKGSGVIKSHHNVGGLPDHVDFDEIIEPLRYLFKDEVRKVGEELGLPGDMVWRQPFPGPGLGVRVIGEITEEKLSILREADAIFREEIVKAGLDKDIWQFFAVLTNIRSTGVTNAERTYDYTIGLRAIKSVDAMTADWARIPYDVLETVSRRIVSEVKHVNRVVYDITTKPPATIEWE